ncbi:MAG: cytochrome c oxidase subunit II [Gammaproteobacteria bacterium]|nr:MAG: cytochrome c oxidase subunit II [Gammaproteobacteria bacterium]
MSLLRSLSGRILATVVSLLGMSAAHADWQLNLPPGVTEISRRIYDLHMLVLWVCVVIGVLVFGVMIYAMVAFRKKDGVKPATWDHSTTAEIIWTVIPVMVLVALAIPAARTLVFIEDTRGAQMNIKITGYQWKWNYEYLDEGVSFFSSLARTSNVARQKDSGIDPASVENYLLEVDRPLVLPAGVKIRYLLTSNDVNHAWWVLDFGIKRDAIPGYINEGWFQVDEPGVYRGQCAELCGKDHGFMPIVVEVLPKAEFDAWLAAQQADAAPAVAATASAAVNGPQ